jgi:hypothetical protein
LVRQGINIHEEGKRVKGKGERGKEIERALNPYRGKESYKS